MSTDSDESAKSAGKLGRKWTDLCMACVGYWDAEYAGPEKCWGCAQFASEEQ